MKKKNYKDFKAYIKEVHDGFRSTIPNKVEGDFMWITNGHYAVKVPLEDLKKLCPEYYLAASESSSGEHAMEKLVQQHDTEKDNLELVPTNTLLEGPHGTVTRRFLVKGTESARFFNNHYYKNALELINQSGCYLKTMDHESAAMKIYNKKGELFAIIMPMRYSDDDLNQEIEVRA